MVLFQVAKSKDELRFALQEAAKNSSVLAEYHHRYELQRQRLEKQISTLTLERDIWNSTAYSLAGVEIRIFNQLVQVLNSNFNPYKSNKADRRK